MLGNTWDLALVLAVEEYDRTLVGSDSEDWRDTRPGNVRGLLFLVGHLDVLELALAH